MKRVFVLDDNLELLDIMERILKPDYTVFLKPNTDKVMDDLISFKPHLIILDHSIGDMNSGKLLNELKSSDCHVNVPVILFSAHIKLPELAASIGADGYIEKPSPISYIREYIKNIFDKFEKEN